MTTLEWIVLGGLFLGIMIFCARIVRKGLSTLEDERRLQKQKIANAKYQIEEDKKNISANEHVSIMLAGVEDLLRLDEIAEGSNIRRVGNALLISTPKGDYELELQMRERLLKSTHRVIHGKNQWILRSGQDEEEHGELLTLMASLKAHIHDETVLTQEPEHLQRRIRAAARTNRLISSGIKKN